MDKPELLFLPPEVLIHIASFLDLTDLLACSATCSYLRSVLNDNWIWKRHYRKNIVDYIKSANSYVKPEFKYQEESDTLEKLCEERQNLLRQNHLLDNWRNGRCVNSETRTRGDGLFLENNDRQIIFNNIYLFLHVVNTDEICVWNIEETPFLYTSVNFTLYEYNREDEDWIGFVRVWYQIVNDKLVVIQGNLVQIYVIKLPDKDIPLEFLISVDRDEAVDSFTETLYTDCYSWIVGHQLFSRLCYLPVVHVWNILSGAKMKTLRAPTSGWDLYVISLDNMERVVFSLRTDDPFATGPEDYAKISNHISSYNVQKDEFTTLFPNLIGCKPVHAIHYRNFVVLFCIDDMFVFRCSVYVFDCLTLNETAHAVFSDLIGLYKSRIVENRLIMATQNSIEVLNVTNLDVLHSIKIDDIIDIDYLPVFNSTFIITSSLKSDLEVWDVNKDEVVLKLPVQVYVYLNESCSKLVMLQGQSLVVKSFW